MPSHKPVKISKDQDLKAVVDYFDRPPHPKRDLVKEAAMKKAAEEVRRDAWGSQS